MRTAAVLALGVFTVSSMAAQQPARAKPAAREGRCRLEIVNVDRKGVVEANTNYYGGGNVFLRCFGQKVSMKSDSVRYVGAGAGQPAVIYFIGNVLYQDTTMEVRARNATYFQNGERWEARDDVKTRNLETGSTLEGPALDYLRTAPGIRDTAEMYSVGRPTIHYVPRSSDSAREEPYVIIGDRVRMRGDDKLWAGGNVTINRSDFSAKGDSLQLFSSDSGSGVLVGGEPMMKGLKRDTFELHGTRIEFDLRQRKVTAVRALGKGHAIKTDLDLTGDTIHMSLPDEKLQQTVAWGSGERPHAVGTSYEVRADSLVIDTPEEKLRELRGFGNGWMGAKPDSGTKERDWIAGDTVRALFAQRDSAGKEQTRVSQLEATGSGRTFYRGEAKRPGAPRPLNYSRADHIVARMKDDEKGGVERVDLNGNVDGVQLDPAETTSAPNAAPAGRSP